jgi:hypothetical protein
MNKTVIAFCVAAAAIVLSGCAYDRGYYDDGYYGGGYYDGYYGGGYYGGGYYGGGYYGGGYYGPDYYPGYYDGYGYYGYAPGAYYGSVYWDRQRRYYDRNRHGGYWQGRPGRYDGQSRPGRNRQPNGWDAIRGRSGPDRNAVRQQAPVQRAPSSDRGVRQPQTAPSSGAPAQSGPRGNHSRDRSGGRGRSAQP